MSSRALRFNKLELSAVKHHGEMWLSHFFDIVYKVNKNSYSTTICLGSCLNELQCGNVNRRYIPPKTEVCLQVSTKINTEVFLQYWGDGEISRS